MLFVLGAFGALAYLYLKKKGVESGLEAQVSEFRAQQQVPLIDHTPPPDATYNEIRATWLECSKTGREQMNNDLTENEKRALEKGANSLHEEALFYDKHGYSNHGEIEGILLEMANH